MIPKEKDTIFSVRIPSTFKKWMEEKKLCGVSYNSQICNALHQQKKNDEAVIELVKTENKNPFS